MVVLSITKIAHRVSRSGIQTENPTASGLNQSFLYNEACASVINDVAMDFWEHLQYIRKKQTATFCENSVEYKAKEVKFARDLTKLLVIQCKE